MISVSRGRYARLRHQSQQGFHGRGSEEFRTFPTCTLNFGRTLPRGDRAVLSAGGGPRQWESAMAVLQRGSKPEWRARDRVSPKKQGGDAGSGQRAKDRVGKILGISVSFTVLSFFELISACDIKFLSSGTREVLQGHLVDLRANFLLHLGNLLFSILRIF